jgi:hypothetical protein
MGLKQRESRDVFMIPNVFVCGAAKNVTCSDLQKVALPQRIVTNAKVIKISFV